jgi:fibronectin-binding autotransporter adhesin
MKTTQRYRIPLAALVAMVSTLQPALAATVIWNGASGSDVNWSTPGNWIGGVPPTSADDVKFFDDGADATPLNVNNRVNNLFGGSVLSLQYGQSNLLYHTTQIEAGQTLTVLGSFTVGTEAVAAQNLDAAITGAGTLVVSNTAVDMVVRQGGDGTSRRATLDLSGLDTFILEVDQVVIGRGDPPGLPSVNRNTGWVYLAKTNRLRAASTSATPGAIGIEVGRSASNNGNGSRLYLGQTNAIFASSLSVGMEKETACQLLFNSIFTGPAAFIRGADGSSRMNLWTIGDGEANSGTTSCQGTADFTGGTVDALVDVMTVGRASANTGGTGNSRGTLTFNAGTVNVNTLQIGQQPLSSGKNGDGVVNVNGGILIVNDSLELGVASGGAGVAPTRGRLTINGGTVQANAISTGAISGGSAITNSGGTLIITNAAGTTAAPLASVSLSDASLHLGTVAVTARMVVTTLTAGGAGNTISVGLIPAITSYPVTFPLIEYQGSIGGAGYNFTLTGLPGAYTGSLVDNSAGGSIDLVLTAGPIAQAVTWVGTTNGNWDASTKNWRVGSTSTNYFDGDFVTFDDSAVGTTTVNLTTGLFPGSLTVNNSALSYTFTGSGRIGGLTGLTKQGSGTLVLNNTGVNNFAAGIAINAGTIQVGSGGTSGNLGAGAVNNNANLTLNRSDDFTVANDIAGSASGTLTKNGAGVVTLSGGNTFTGAVAVVTGTLKAGNAAALGQPDGVTTISSGATLDVNALNLGAEPIIVSGAGVGGNGAIINSGGQQLNALRYVTLTGDTTFGNPGRWDIRGAPSTADPANAGLSTGGNPYTLTKIGTNTVGLVGVTVDPALGDVDVQQGALAFETASTGLGNPASNLIVRAGATLNLFNTTNHLNKIITLNGSGTNNTVSAGDGVITLNHIIGPMALNGECWMNVNVSDFMTFSNAITGGGGASFVKQGGGTLVLAGPPKTYAGNTTVSNGVLVVNSTLSGGGTLTALAGTTLSGTGTNTGPVIVGGTLMPGTSAGTFGAGSLTLESGASIAFELAAVNTIGSGVNDLIQVNGNLTVNDNSFTFGLLDTALQAGSYRLINYTGSLIGNLNTNASLGGLSRYVLAIDTNTPGQVNLIVSGSAGALAWNSLSSSVWDIGVSSNWFNSAIPGEDAFFQGDSVVFGDTAGLLTTIDISANVAVAPATLTVDSTNNFYTINGPGRISGGANLVKKGDSLLILNSTNDFIGTVTIQQGTLQIGNNSALGSVAGGTIVSSGATLDIGAAALPANAVNLGTESITVSGAGVFGLGAIVNNTLVNQQNAVRVVNLTGNTTLGGNGRWDIRGAGAALSTGGTAYNLRKVGANQITLVGVAVDPAFGNVDVQQGIFSIETTSTAGDPAKTFAIQSGATLQFFNLSLPLDKKVALTNATINNDSGNNTMVGPVLMDGFCTIDVDGGSSLTLSNTLSGAASLTKVETGTLNLTAIGYNGDTTINAGTLALLGTASLAGSPNLTLTAGGLDLSGRVDGTLTLVGGQKFFANGTVTGALTAGGSSIVSVGGDFVTGRLVVSGATAFSAGSTNLVDVDKSSFTNDVLTAASITYGGKLVVTSVSLPLGAGDNFKLFNAGSYAGAFASIEPATPGAGLVWDTSDLVNSGTLRVASATPLPPPDIDSFVYTGSDVTLTVTNGPAYGPYRVLTTTNLALPVASWSVLTTNYFDASGQINPPFNTPVNPGQAQQFFMLSVP